jgi:peptidoglycan/xylan/chitin deacetylase (PgdA/CDA1 family)
LEVVQAGVSEKASLELDGTRLRFDPDPFEDGFMRRLESGARGSTLTFRLGDSVAVLPIEPDDTPLSLGIKSRSICRDLLEDAIQPLPPGTISRSGRAPIRSSRSRSRGMSLRSAGRALVAGAALSCGVVQARNVLRRRAKQTPGVIANFHRVADDGTGHWMTLSTHEFARYVRFMRDHYTVVSIAELRRRLATGENTEPLLAITFDDGYRECLDCVAPVLEELDCPASFYVCSQFLDADGDFEHDRSRGYVGLPKLRTAEVRRLHDLGFEIGSHGHSHMDFRSASVGEIETEVVESRDLLEAAIGDRVRGLAVPFGSRAHCRAEVFEAARRAGYEYVLSHFDGQNRPGADGFHLLRVRPNLEGLVMLRAAIEGWRGIGGLVAPAPDARLPLPVSGAR